MTRFGWQLLRNGPIKINIVCFIVKVVYAIWLAYSWTVLFDWSIPYQYYLIGSFFYNINTNYMCQSNIPYLGLFVSLLKLGMVGSCLYYSWSLRNLEAFSDSFLYNQPFTIVWWSLFDRFRIIQVKKKMLNLEFLNTSVPNETKSVKQYPSKFMFEIGALMNHTISQTLHFYKDNSS